MSLSSLDWTQVLRSAHDEVSGALKTIPASGSVTEISLSHTDGDSVLSYSAHGSASGSAPASGSPGDVVISEVAVSGFDQAQLFALSNGVLGTPASATLQISPLASGGLWHSVATLQSSAVSGGVVATAVQSFAAKRARVILSVAPVGGSADYHLVLNG
jgi:hypothetical protein